MENYFIIYFGEDGITITPSNKNGVQKLVDEIIENEDKDAFVEHSGKFYMDGGDYPIYKHMIIKGELVIPKPVEIIKKYEI